eukprot:3854191-Rhodomonas_salina.1
MSHSTTPPDPATTQYWTAHAFESMHPVSSSGANLLHLSLLPPALLFVLGLPLADVGTGSRHRGRSEKRREEIKKGGGGEGGRE